jgi:uncharacterized protein
VTRNPFQYGSPVDSKHFAGRAEELKALTARMADGINVVLVSPRRYGKTSLLLRAEEELGQLGAAMVHIDILRCASSAELAAKLAGEAFRLPSGRWHRVKNTVSEFAHRLKVSPTITLSADGSPQFSFAGDLARRDVHQVLEDVYALLAEDAARRSGVLVLDEFQAVTDLDEHLPAVLKALSDSYGSVSLVLAGSRRHLMERLTGSTGAPLYGMAEPLGLGPVATADMADYLRRRASGAGKPMTAQVAGRVIDIAGPIPNDIQRLAYSAYEAADNEIGADEVNEGMEAVVFHGDATYAESYGRFAPGQRRVLRTLAARPQAEIFSAHFARDVQLANAASVRKAVDTLTMAEVITREGEIWNVADPFFRYWLNWILGISEVSLGATDRQ